MNHNLSGAKRYHRGTFRGPQDLMAMDAPLDILNEAENATKNCATKGQNYV